MKKYARLLLLTLFAVAVMLFASACTPDAELALKDDAMPQAVFVLGEQIDLSGGRITVTEGDEVYEIDMTAEGVEISGYNKDALGEQTITLTYNNGEVSFKVNVVERMKAEDYAADYLVGDSLDLSKGRLKITRNDGSNFTVALNSTKVTVEGFDSATVGERTLVAKYKSDGNEYTASFKVNVHEVESVSLTPPTKVAYKSHDTAIDVTGGFLTFVGNDGSIKRELPITAEMTSGFDMSAVNSTNTPYTQEITVTHDGKEYTYDIKITYTGVSDFRDSSALVVSDIDFDEWDGWEDLDYIPAIDDEVGSEAVRIMELYLDMSPAEQGLLDLDTVKKVARVAMTWAFDVWSTDFVTFSDAFGIEDGALTFYCVSEEAVAAAIEGLADTDRPIYAYTDIMASLVEAFAEDVVYGVLTFESFPTVPNDMYAEISGIFEYMLALDAKMDAVPANWRELGVDSFGEEIDEILDFIVSSDYYSYSYAQIYYLTSAWRDADDAFDYLYSYYYALEDVESLVYLANIRLPKELEEIYSHILTAVEQANAINTYQAVDTTYFFYSVYMAQKLTEELFAGEDEMQQILFYSIPLNGMLGISGGDDDYIYTFDAILQVLITGEGGYYYFSSGLLGVEAYHELMDKYMSVIDKWLADEDGSYEASAAYGEDIEELLRLYMELTPTQQSTFIGIISVYYGMGMPPLAFDVSDEFEGFESLFAALLREYYQGLFTTDAAKAAYVDLMVAVELFSQRFTNTEWSTEFSARLAAVREAYESSMTDEEKSIFDSKLMSILVEYEALAERLEDDSAVDYKGWEEKFNELHDAIVRAELAYQFVSEGYEYYGLFYSAFERALAIANDILTNAPAEVIDAYMNENLYSNKEIYKIIDPEWVDDDPSTTVYWCYEYVVTYYRSVYISMINSNIIAGESVYDYYVSGGLGEFFDAAYDLFWAYLFDDGSDSDVYDKAASLAVLDAFRALDTQSRVLFLAYFERVSGGYSSLYLEAVSAFLAEDYSEAAAAVADYLLYLEISYMNYDYFKDEESLEALKSDLAELKTAYAALGEEGEDKESFADFEAAYAANVQLVEEAIAAAEAESEGEAPAGDEAEA